jgi:hypothetical protein
MFDFVTVSFFYGKNVQENKKNVKKQWKKIKSVNTNDGDVLFFLLIFETIERKKI